MNKSIMFLVFAAGLVFADDDERGPNFDQDVDVDTIVESNITLNPTTTMNSTSNMTNSTSSRAYGFGLGDVDIAQCYRSYQLLIWQDSKINPFCVADSYDQKGLHVMAAVIRCDIGFIRKHFDSDSGCIDANTMLVEAPRVATETVAAHESFEEHIVVEQTHEGEIEELRQEQTYQFQEIEMRLDQIDVARRGYAEDQRQKRVYAKGLLKQLGQRTDDGNDPES